MTTPNWVGASAGSQPLAAQVNQFLGSHAITYVYGGTSFASQGTAGAGNTSTNGTWLAESFTTAASTTSLGRARITLGYTGAPTPMTLSVYASTGTAPTGSALVSTTVPTSYLTAGGATVSIPVPVNMLTPSTQYWLVVPAVGDPSNFYTWNRNNQVSGASTSPDGVTWTPQAYGFIYNVFDLTLGSGSLAHTWEDSGARWLDLVSTAANVPTALTEYTVAQAANDYVYSSRTLTYDSSGLNLISVT